jgi:hypothetical protein
MDRFVFAITFIAFIALGTNAQSNHLLRKEKPSSQNEASRQEDTVATPKKPLMRTARTDRKQTEETKKIPQVSGESSLEVSSDMASPGKMFKSTQDFINEITEFQKKSKSAERAAEAEKLWNSEKATSKSLRTSGETGEKEKVIEHLPFSEASLAQEAVVSEDELLYQKLFPQEREAEEEAKTGSVLEQGVKSFRIRVPVDPEGKRKRYCLTEGFHDFTVRAEPCRKGFKNQDWYWTGSQLKNLYSTHRCLGLRNHHGLMRSADEHQEFNMHLSMAFDCADPVAPLHWKIDDKGRLTNAANSQCIALGSWTDNYMAMVLPCEDAA